MLIKLTSKFRPFSFDEMTKPLILYKEAYDKYQEKYDDLVMNTEKWKDIVNETGSPEAYAMYKRYSNQLNTAVDDFMLEMTMKTGRLFLGLRRGYASDIIPIENAKKAYDKMVETREKIKSADDSAVFLNKYNSIDNFLHGKVADNSYISGNKLQTRIAFEIENWAKSKYGKMKLDEVLSQGYIDRYVQENGFSPEVYLEIIRQNPTSDAAKDIQAIINNTLDGVGYRNLTEADLKELYSYAMTGAAVGLSKPAYSTISSGKEQVEAKQDRDRRYQLDLDRFNTEKLEAAEQKELKKIEAAATMVAYGANLDLTLKYVYGTTNINLATRDRIEQGAKSIITSAVNKNILDKLKSAASNPSKIKTADTKLELQTGGTYTGSDLKEIKSAGIKKYAWWNVGDNAVFGRDRVITATDATPYAAALADAREKPSGSEKVVINWSSDKYKVNGFTPEGAAIITAGGHNNAYGADPLLGEQLFTWKTWNEVKNNPDVLAIALDIRQNIIGVNPENLLWHRVSDRKNNNGKFNLGRWYTYDPSQGRSSYGQSTVENY